MDTQKRRVVYLSDPEWEDIRKRATHQGVTMSAYIRSSLIGGHVTPISLQREAAEGRGPFATFRPAPKPGTKTTPRG